MSSFLFTSSDYVLSSLTSILCLEQHVLKSRQKHSVFSAEDYIWSIVNHTKTIGKIPSRIRILACSKLQTFTKMSKIRKN